MPLKLLHEGSPKDWGDLILGAEMFQVPRVASGLSVVRES